MTITEFWNGMGIAETEMMSRFVGNLDLAKKCTLMFAHEKNYSELCAAAAEKNYDAVEETAHALKGVGANLGFERFRILAQRLVDDVRSGRYESVDFDFSDLRDEFERLRAEIERID